MKKYTIFFIFIFSACSGSLPYHVYHTDSYIGATGFIITKSPIYILHIDGMSIFEIKRKFEKKKTGNFDQKKGFYLISGIHTITVDGSPSPSGSKLSGTHTFKILIKPDQRYLISYEKPSKHNEGELHQKIFIVNMTTREVITSKD